MKSLAIHGLPCRRSHSKVAVILIVLVFLSCFSLILFNTASVSADDQATKAVRRATSNQRRVALVIGNSDYKNCDALHNPTHDAEDIANVLRGLGFTIQTRMNADQREMDEAVREFVREIQNGDVGLFYFSGHGVQVNGENYLIPVSGSIETEAQCKYRAVNAGEILGRMEESGNRINIFILDACRNNPFKGFRSMSKGLAMMDARGGTFIAYATAAGQVAKDGEGRNSPFAKHLMQAIKTKHVGIAQVFMQVSREVGKETDGKQIPWIASSLQDDFWFNPGDTSLPASELPRVTASPDLEPADYKAQIEREKRGSEQEIAKLREARRVAALERERLEREKQEMQRERERVASLPAPTATRLGAGKEKPRTPDYKELQRFLESMKTVKKNDSQGLNDGQLVDDAIEEMLQAVDAPDALRRKVGALPREIGSVPGSNPDYRALKRFGEAMRMIQKEHSVSDKQLIDAALKGMHRSRGAISHKR